MGRRAETKGSQIGEFSRAAREAGVKPAVIVKWIIEHAGDLAKLLELLNAFKEKQK